MVLVVLVVLVVAVVAVVAVVVVLLSVVLALLLGALSSLRCVVDDVVSLALITAPAFIICYHPAPNQPVPLDPFPVPVCPSSLAEN